MKWDAVKRVANNIAVMEKGKVIEKGDLREVFLHPQKQLTRQFVGGALQAQHILNTYNFDKLADMQNYISWFIALMMLLSQ